MPIPRVPRFLLPSALLTLLRVLLQTPGPGQYRFPHFGIIGFQKCATTSLFR